MNSPNDLSLQDFMQDLRGPAAAEEWRGNWAMALLYRRPGILLAWICAHLRLRPTTVTCAAFGVALSLPILAWFLPLTFAPWTVCLCAMLFQILDCTDGTLARQTGQTSKAGADMDALVDMAQWALLYTSIGLLADRSFETEFTWTAVGVLAAWTRLMARVVRDRLQSSVNDRPSDIGFLDYPSLFLGGISGLIPLFALSGDYLHWAVIALFIYGLMDIIEGLIPLFKK